MIRPHALRLSFGWGEDDWDFEAPLPLDYTDGWMHLIVTVDRAANEASLYLDFKKVISLKMHPALADYDLTSLPFTIGQDGTREHPTQLSAVIDEFILTKEVIGEDTVEKMKEFYNR